MGLIQADLSLDLKPTYVPKNMSDFVKDISLTENVEEKLAKIDAYAKQMEDEKEKIEVFKRELPQTMLLVNDAIQYLKEEAMQIQALRKTGPVSEGLKPLNKEPAEEKNVLENLNNFGVKNSWLGLSNACNSTATGNSSFGLQLDAKRIDEQKRSQIDDVCPITKDGNTRRFFAPFKPYSSFPDFMVRREEKDRIEGRELSLLTSGMTSREQPGSSVSNTSSGRAISFSAQRGRSNSRIGSQRPQQQPARKPRRCWSPELHRLFLNALEQLGGGLVATPKQIRELMKVDGLTNEEVKSHLQKHRLHTRNAPAATHTSANRSAAVPGGLWMSADSSNASSSRSPEGPLQLAGANGEPSLTGDSIEGEEDGKSESYSYSRQSRLSKN